MSQDLWPDGIVSPLAEKAPVVILKEQAVALGKKTGNLVEASVERGVRSTFVSEEFVYEFWLRAPALDYRTLLFTIEHPIEFYPLVLSVESTGQELKVVDEQSFLQALKAVFSASDTVRMIQSLMAQSTA